MAFVAGIEVGGVALINHGFERSLSLGVKYHPILRKSCSNKIRESVILLEVHYSQRNLHPFLPFHLDKNNIGNSVSLLLVITRDIVRTCSLKRDFEEDSDFSHLFGVNSSLCEKITGKFPNSSG